MQLFGGAKLVDIKVAMMMILDSNATSGIIWLNIYVF